MKRYLKWFGRAVRPYRGAMAVMMMCHLLLACCSVAFVYVSKRLVDVAVAMYGGNAVEKGLAFWAVCMAGIILLRISLNALRSYLQTRTEINLKNSLRYRLFDALLHQRTGGGAQHHSGDILNRMQEDVRMVSSVLASSIPNLFGTVLQFVAAFVFLLVLDVRLAVVIIIVVPLGLFVGKYISGRIRNLTLDIRRSDSKVQAHLQESLQHRTLLQSMEYIDGSTSALDDLQSSLYDNELKRTKFSIVSRIFISIAFQTGHAVAFLWGVGGIASGTVTYGMMTAFLQLVGQIQRPLVDMSSQLPAIIHATASVDRLMELEMLPREETGDMKMLAAPAGIRLEDVSFAYPESDRQVLHGFSHDFAPGSRTAVVGPTGIGKSTLIRLLLSLLAPQSGKIEIYDASGALHPVSAATRRNLVYVPQGNSLFSGTIRENLLMGNPEATDAQLENALRTAAADFVFGLPCRLETQCFEAGAALSEGQAQRIAIARALLRPGSVLLLDEFSSALDADTETLLMERLTSELPDHTMIFITHREKIIDYCDSVLRASSFCA